MTEMPAKKSQKPLPSLKKVNINLKRTSYLFNDYPDGLAKAISRARGGMWGNIIFGGGVGAIIDHSRGTGYAYSDQMIVIMGKTTLYDREAGTSPKASQ